MQDSPIAKLAALVHTLRSFGILRVSLGKAREIARAMNAALGASAGHRSGSGWIYQVELDGAQLRLCVPVGAAAELEGAIVSLHAGRPVVAELEAVEAPTSPRQAALAELREKIAAIQKGTRAVASAAARIEAAQRRQLPAGESDLSWTVKVATAARARPEVGSEAWRVLRAS